MSAEELAKAVADAQEAVTKQGDTVRSLKASLKDGKVDKVRTSGIAPGAVRLLDCSGRTLCLLALCRLPSMPQSSS
jgi:hypothetical protein